MEFQGKIVSIYHDFANNKNMILISTDHDIRSPAQLLLNKTLRIVARQWREKRSLDANAYAWGLMSRIAEVVGSTKDLIYEEMLRRRGVLARNEDGTPITVTLPAKVDIETLSIHLNYYSSSYVGSKKFNCYLVIKGSSEYDTKEMSEFIDEIVYECKNLEIETMTQEELGRMKAAWKQ